MAFLFALGLVYGIAYACVKNVLVLWPVLIPLGSFYNNLQSGGIELPWTFIAGFVDVMAIVFAANLARASPWAPRASPAADQVSNARRLDVNPGTRLTLRKVRR
jgi:hypothetical protein